MWEVPFVIENVTFFFFLVTTFADNNLNVLGVTRTIELLTQNRLILNFGFIVKA